MKEKGNVSLCILILHIIANPRYDQLTAVKTGYPLTTIIWPYRGLRYWPIEVKYFLKLSANKLLVFNWSQAQVYVFLKKFMWSTLRLCHYGSALLRFWFQTDLGHKNSARHLKTQAGKTFFYHGQALVTLYVQFICSDWSKFDSSCEKFMQHLKTCLLWQLKLTEFRVNLWCS